MDFPEHYNVTDLNATIGIIPPEARGCGIDHHKTVRELNGQPLSSIYDPDLEKSRCYDVEDMQGYAPNEEMEVEAMEVETETTSSLPAQSPLFQGKHLTINSKFVLGFLTALVLAYIVSKL